MKAVLGFLFLLVGFTVGYLVLSGKLPNANITSPTATTTDTSPSMVTTERPPIRGGVGSGPTGIPTMAFMNDLIASNGGYKS